MKKDKKPQPYPLIHKNNCKACDRCILACKQNALIMSKDLNDIGYHYAKYIGESCNGCGDCYYTCPEPLAIEVHIPKASTLNDDSDDTNTEDTNGEDTIIIDDNKNNNKDVKFGKEEE